MPVSRPVSKDDLLKRLHRIEGQVRGVAKMVEDDRDCQDIVQQLAAIRSAAQQVSLQLIRSYACRCLFEPQAGDDPEAMLADLLDVLGRAT